MITPISELSWTLTDYLAAEVEPPARIRDNPGVTEGDMMSEEEIEEFIKDSVATLRILSDKQSPRHAQILANYHADLAFLTKLGRLTEDDYQDLIHPDNLSF